jgi:mRNA interferase HigB
MHVISKHALAAFWLKHPAARAPLEAWYRLVKASAFWSFNELKKTFSTADYVPPFVIFDVGGNNFRVICAVHFDRQKLYIREVFTHAEYDRWSKTYRSKKP